MSSRSNRLFRGIARTAAAGFLVVGCTNAEDGNLGPEIDPGSADLATNTTTVEAFTPTTAIEIPHIPSVIDTATSTTQYTAPNTIGQPGTWIAFVDQASADLGGDICVVAGFGIDITAQSEMTLEGSGGYAYAQLEIEDGFDSLDVVRGSEMFIDPNTGAQSFSSQAYVEGTAGNEVVNITDPAPDTMFRFDGIDINGSPIDIDVSCGDLYGLSEPLHGEGQMWANINDPQNFRDEYTPGRD